MIAWLLLAACAPSIADLRLNEDTAAPDTDLVVGLPTTDDTSPEDTALTDGTVLLVVDASSTTDWVYVDLDRGTLTDEDGPWSLRAQRYHLDLYDGGEAPLEAVWSAPASTAPTPVPTEGWGADAPDADDDGTPEYALAEWYAYDKTTHLLTPTDRRWWVRTRGGQVRSLVFTSYYDSAGTSGFPTFELSAPD